MPDIFGLMAWSLASGGPEGIIVTFEGPRGKGQSLMDLEQTEKVISELIRLRTECWPEAESMLLVRSSQMRPVPGANATAVDPPIPIEIHRV